MAYEAKDVAEWFLSKEAMSPKKIQKMIYYAYSWFLTFYNETEDNLRNRLFNDKIEAWVHGPVIPSIYHAYKDRGYTDIDKINQDLDSKFDKETLDVLNQVYEVYGGYNGNELESITHQESPWINAREGLDVLDSSNEVISDSDIFECYSARLG